MEQENTENGGSAVKKEYLPLKSAADEDGEPNITSVTVEEIINRVVGNNGSLPRYILFLSIFLLSQLTYSMMCYHPIFNGYIPYSEWNCSSDKCFALQQQHNDNPDDNGTDFFSRHTMCSNGLVAGADFTWTPLRTSFAIDWDIYCKTEKNKSSINSFFFVGALIGLLVSSSLFDQLGRKVVVIGAGFVAVFATLIQAFASNIEVMLGLRIIQGLGAVVGYNGKVVWMFEFAPIRLRNFTNAIVAVTWPIGGSIMILISFMMENWRHNVCVVAGVAFILHLPLFLCPESIRYLICSKKDKDARVIINKLAAFYGTPKFEDDITLASEDSNVNKKSLLEQLKDFTLYPVMMKRTLFLSFCFIIVALLYYGLSFGWHKMGSSIFESQSLAVLSEIIACTSTFSLVQLFGAKKTQISSFLGIALCFAIAMIPLHFSQHWTLQQVACLVAIVFIGCEFVTIFLYTSELSPTSHRGMIVAFCSGSARLGSISGPYVSLLYDYLDQRVVLGIFGGMSLIAAIGTWFLLDDTTQVGVPETPTDLQKCVRKHERLDPSQEI